MYLHFYNLAGKIFYQRPVLRTPSNLEQMSDLLSTSLEQKAIVALTMQPLPSSNAAHVGIFEWGPLWGFYALTPTETAPLPDKDFSTHDVIQAANVRQHDSITH